MAIAKNIFWLSTYFPDLGIRSASVGKYCSKAAGRTCNEGKYLSFSLFASLFAGMIVAWVSASAFASEELPLLAPLAGFLAAFGLAFLVLLRLPLHIERARTERMEAEMPALLRTFGMLLDMRVPFTDALRAAAKEGEAGKEFLKVVEEAERGASIPKALAKFAEASESAVVKKSSAQLISAYEHGAHGSEIRRIADDLLSLQSYRMRDFVSKSSFFGLLFVIFAAVVPTFFLVFATAGKFALDIEIGAGAFAFVFLVVFPIVNAAILLVSASSMPPSIFRSEWRGVNLWAFAALAALLAAVMLLDLEGIQKLAALAAVSALSWSFFRGEYAEESRVEKIEEALPDALLGVSGLPKNYGIEKIFERLALARDALGAEAGKTLRQLRANVSAEKALADLWERNRSFMFRRMGELMLNSHLAGANISEKMHEMAEDLLKFGELRRERENALSMQKYTLILGAFIVPLILTTSLSLASQITALMEQKGNEEVVALAPGVISAYVIIYAALSALYISHSEDRTSRVVPYFVAMALAGLAGFYILSQQFS